MACEWKLGDWIVRPQRDSIERGQEAVHLKPKAMAVLTCLLEAGGQVVTRSGLFERVWPGAIVSDATLTQCISEIRHAFGDSAQQPEIIETIPKVGFRLLAPVQRCDSFERSAPASALARLPAWAYRFSLAILVVATVWLAVTLGSAQRTSPGHGAQSSRLAVLPFRDLSEDGSQGWLAAGLTEEMIARLSPLEGLRVTGRTSSQHYRFQNVTVDEIADQLGVEHVLEGSVRRLGDRLRVTAQLVEARRGDRVWSEVYDRDAAELLEVQQDIARSVAEALSISLGVGELGRRPGGTNSVLAYEHYSRAWDGFHGFTAGSMLEAIDRLQRAVTIDPDYGQAWLLLAHLYKLAPAAVDNRVEQNWLELADQALAQARQVAPEMPELLGMLVNQYTHRGDWVAAELSVREAGPIEDCMQPDLLFFYGILMAHVGRGADAVRYLERARLLDPLAAHTARMLGHAYLMQGRLEDALTEYERAWGMQNVLRRAGSWEGLEAALHRGDRETIATWLERAIANGGDAERSLLLTMARNIDRPAEATAWLRQALDDRGWSALNLQIATWAAYFGDAATARKVYFESPESWAVWTPLLATVRGQPEFKQAVEQLGLVDYWRRFGWSEFCQPSGAEGYRCG